MSSIVVQAFITLDGVVQAPGGTDEDREGGFEHGGWQFAFYGDGGEGDGADSSDGSDPGTTDPGTTEDDLIREWEGRTEALLLGRRTYEIFAGSWGVWDEAADGFEGELTRRYNRVPKYVASRTLTELGWKNSELLGPDVPAAVERLRAAPGGEIRVWGSTQLIGTLAERDLIDEYRLVVYPLILGTGKRLFPDGFPHTRLALAESRATGSGVVVNTYRRA